ncbi:uncharacterized protein F4812DRAFT_464010 [Daldinia caldariorum]|uniref:uncharacterized protein n=1 Tax=Daldinia caldariorum TaxID=326644 RepID=UPI0020076752|nr:uncharacterized protein F4812DRAFT_464010 [Daldinia caldariorum]KAI1463158.1 hypothetical protein F4812DRAFT_464010 [Daldinia caldariorum]
MANPPPHLDLGQEPFWQHLQRNLEQGLAQGSASLYFRLYGRTDHTPPPSEWREVEWTLQDFAYFYDCPEYEAARMAYLTGVAIFPLAPFPTWAEVVYGMQFLFNHVDMLVDYMHVRPEVLINKSPWKPLDFAVGFVLRLLNYREHIESDVIDRGEMVNKNTDFLERQINYANTLGKVQPFYQHWGSSDKWTAAFLLYTKLQFEHEAYVKPLMENPLVLVNEYHKAMSQIGQVSEEAQRRYNALRALELYF